MKNSILSLLLLVSGLLFSCQAQNEDAFVLIKTNKGDMKVKLYAETPLHRDNFLKLAQEDFYDSLLFHRVIQDFMIQAGDPKSKGATPGQMLGSGGPGYKIDAEIKPGLFHKKGALSAARQGGPANPEKKSSGSQFYIVQGSVLSTEKLDMMEKQLNARKNAAGIRTYLSRDENKAMRDTVMKLQQARNGHALDSLATVIVEKLKAEGTMGDDFTFSAQQRTIYTTVGGTPFLDNDYTVFGEVVEGLEVIDKIAAVPTGRGDRPTEDVIILDMQVLK